MARWSHTSQIVSAVLATRPYAEYVPASEINPYLRADEEDEHIGTSEEFAAMLSGIKNGIGNG